MTVESAFIGESALILCVEDEEALRRDIADELFEAGYRVIEAATGEQALAQCAVARPDLILCDICMPGMDGYAVLRALHDEPGGYADIPFLFLSALADRREVVEGKLLGADDYLTKPIDFDLLLATVHARLRQISRIRAHTAPSGGEIEAHLAALARADRPTTGSGFGAVLDLISTAIVLVGPEGETCFTNRAAQGLIAATPPLGQALKNYRGRPVRKEGLLAWLDQMLMHNDDNVSSFTLYSDEQDDELRMVGCRLANEASDGPRLALFIAPASKSSDLSPGPLEAMFGFTPTESLIAVELARGSKPAEIAVSLGIAQTTVAFHMRNIFQKTGVSRQASLVALLLTSPVGLL